MGHRHRRRAHRGLAVDLGMVALVDLGVVAAQPDSADREATIASTLRDTGFLQQWQRTAACADEDELGPYRSLLAAVEVLNLDPPAPSLLADDVGDAILVMHAAARKPDQMVNQMMGEGAIVYISARDDPRRCNGLVAGPALHHQRCPFRDLLPILG